MYKYFFILILLLSKTSFTFSQQMNSNTYQKQWASIDEAFSKGLPQTAQKEIEQLLLKTKAEKNTDQYIKALCYYRVSLRDRDEKSSLHDMQFFQKEIQTAVFPAKQLLHSMLAELYWTYYEEHRWNMLERTSIDREELKSGKHYNDEIETWTAATFFDEITKEYHASLEEASALKKVKLSDFEQLIDKGKNTLILRPTLYDFLAHRALEYYEMEENEIHLAAYAFEIQDENAFAPNILFANRKIETSDKDSKKYQALKIFQELILFHANDEDPSALIDVDLNRLNFVYEESTHLAKDSLYQIALKHIVKQYPHNSQAALASVLLAEQYVNENTYNPRNITSQNSNINPALARTMVLEIIEKFPATEAYTRAKTLLLQIESRLLQMQTEKVVLPMKPSLVRVDYKNLKEIFIKVIPLTNEEYKSWHQVYDNTVYETILNKKDIKNWSVVLPQKNDFLAHSTELKIEALQLGVYAIAMSETKEFKQGACASFAFLSVSNLSHITASSNTNNFTELYVVHRDTGEPLENVEIRTHSNEYNYNQRKYNWKHGKTYKSDKDGKVVLEPSKLSYQLELIRDNDNLFLPDNMYVHPNTKSEPRDYLRSFLFTDRSIYRPGQTIFFKCILINKIGNQYNKYEVVKNKETIVKLLDANHQVVKEQTFKSNEYGSFSGTFQAPEGLLTGQFQLVAESGRALFNVEEYKRPQFEVKFDTLKNSYQLQDQITVKGVAKAYAGNQIDGASVSYRVVRESRFPYYWCYSFWGRPQSASMEIANGKTKTLQDGSFSIPFVAIPDLSIDKRTEPVFTYTIYADVTDINGETRSGETMLSISYKNIEIKLDAPTQIHTKDFQSIVLKTNNLSGAFIPSTVILSLKKLSTPQAVYKKRLWNKVEYNLIDEQSFRRDFPLDEYNNENEIETWKIEKTIWDKTIQSTESGMVNLPKTDVPSGMYVLEASTKDKNGEQVLEKKFIRINATNNLEALPFEQAISSALKEQYEPGDKIEIVMATAYKKVFLLTASNYGKDYTSNMSKDADVQWTILNPQKSFEYKLNESDRGGFFITGIYIKHNRRYYFTSMVNVPFTNKELDIQLETFRDKILPGSEQEWKIKIAGSKKEKVSAELLATMYDASLDAYKLHRWENFGLFPNRHQSLYFNTYSNFILNHGMQVYYPTQEYIEGYEKTYPYLNWWNLNSHYGGIRIGGDRSSNVSYMMDGMALEGAPNTAFAPPSLKSEIKKMPLSAKMGYKNLEESTVSATSMEQKEKPELGNSNVAMRSNFNETAFFFPHLYTDENGNIILKFKAPDALTRWKLMAFAHTTQIQSQLLTATSNTQKELMIVPNTPRFLREGDAITYSAKVTNLSDKDIKVLCQMDILNAVNNESLNKSFEKELDKEIVIKKESSEAVQWNIKVPNGFTDPVLIKIIAKNSTISDGEQQVLPVLSNTMLVTETLPLPVKINSKKSFRFENLLNSKSSNTLRHHNLTVEYTANPAWYAIQALPYLTDYPYDCAEQTFNRYYANELSAHIAQSNPQIKQVFSTWKDTDTMALLSNLEKNTELKSALLAETPWVMDAQNETQQKKKIATLFEINRMSKETHKAAATLYNMQSSNGGFVWFKGMPEDRYITQYIMTGVGRLIHLGVNKTSQDEKILSMIEKAIPYLDRRLKEDYEELKKLKVDLQKQHISHFQIQYLYMRSFFKEEMPISQEIKKAFDYYLGQSEQYGLKQNKYMQAMCAIVLHRWNKKTAAQDIIRSLRETAIHHEELGMYWKELTASYWWYESPIEAQSLMIECFKEVAASETEVDELKIWLIKNKQTTAWNTSRATADACYALLLNGTYWLSTQPDVSIQLGNKKIQSLHEKQEAGTGYFKTHIEKEQIDASQGNIQVEVKNNAEKGKNISGTTWGAVYWQYFENLDKITSQETPLKIKKDLYKVVLNDKGEKLIPITEQYPLQVGDKIKVKIELRVDRPMEYVHLKDMRATCFEPINVLSQYKFQGGLGYYEATKDMATNFFFHYLQKGTYVFEYPMFVTHKGDFSNGVATIQCMYAPEFSSHSEGLKVSVK
ncbi:MAG: MG2 domain-containing protein [Chitinophagaceae bacterium]